MVVRAGSRRARPGTAAAGHRFVAATEALDGGTSVVSVIGEVDLATAHALERTLLGVADDRTLKLVVDLTDCSFLDGRAVSVLVATRARLERSRRRLAVIASSPSVLRIFQVTGLGDVFDIYPSRREGLDGNGNAHA